MPAGVTVDPAELRDAVAPERLAPWLEANVSGFGTLVTVERISGGHSNLTFRLTSADGMVVALRRPPRGKVQPTANDVLRESRIMGALGPTPVPVPRVFAECTDLAVIGVPFFVMDFVQGHVLRDRRSAEALPETARLAAGNHLVDVLAELHAVRPADVGLGELGAPDGYIERQLRRWFGQYERTRIRERPALEQVHEALHQAIPTTSDTAIVHGDYRLDNTIVDDGGQIRAVLDWEICTLGDPLADLGLMCAYWPEPGEKAMVVSTTTAVGFPSRAEVVARYAERSGRDVSAIDYYVAFGWWKLACIADGVLARYRVGGLGVDADLERMDRLVDLLSERAAECVRRLG